MYTPTVSLDMGRHRGTWMYKVLDSEGSWKGRSSVFFFFLIYIYH